MKEKIKRVIFRKRSFDLLPSEKCLSKLVAPSDIPIINPLGPLLIPT